MSLRPVVADPLRAGLAEIARIVPTDVTTEDDVIAYHRVAAERGTNAAAVATRRGLIAADPAEWITSFSAARAPATRVVFLHGGGLIAGNRFDGVDVLARHAEELGLDVWTVEYPLAPRANFDEMVAHAVRAVELAAAGGLPVALAGQSAGGGVAAAAALACRERGIPVAGVMLLCPMLADSATVSSHQFTADPSWSARSNATAWALALEGAVVQPPGLRKDLAGLPPVYLDTGSAEIFRDSITVFASALWESGVSAELHVWSGGFHGFDSVVEGAIVSKESHRARREWLRRLGDGGL